MLTISCNDTTAKISSTENHSVSDIVNYYHYISSGMLEEDFIKLIEKQSPEKIEKIKQEILSRNLYNTTKTKIAKTKKIVPVISPIAILKII